MYRATSTTATLLLSTFQDAGNIQGQLFASGYTDPLYAYDLAPGDATGVLVMTIQYKLFSV